MLGPPWLQGLENFQTLCFMRAAQDTTGPFVEIMKDVLRPLY